MSLLTDVLDYLESVDLVGGSTGWTRAANFLPPTPDQVVAVFETPGNPPELIPIGSTEQEYDDIGFQIRVRAEKYAGEALDTQIRAIYKELHGTMLNPDEGEPAYILVQALQSGQFPLGLDANDRPGATWNFLAMREREE